MKAYLPVAPKAVTLIEDQSKTLDRNNKKGRTWGQWGRQSWIGLGSCCRRRLEQKLSLSQDCCFETSKFWCIEPFRVHFEMKNWEKIVWWLAAELQLSKVYTYGRPIVLAAALLLPNPSVLQVVCWVVCWRRSAVRTVRKSRRIQKYLIVKRALLLKWWRAECYQPDARYHVLRVIWTINFFTNYLVLSSFIYAFPFVNVQTFMQRSCSSPIYPLLLLPLCSTPSFYHLKHSANTNSDSLSRTYRPGAPTLTSSLTLSTTIRAIFTGQ